VTSLELAAADHETCHLAAGIFTNLTRVCLFNLTVKSQKESDHDDHFCDDDNQVVQMLLDLIEPFVTFSPNLRQVRITFNKRKYEETKMAVWRQMLLAHPKIRQYSQDNIRFLIGDYNVSIFKYEF